eukprot:CAMPEP_0202058490 /NCGR_PEP_ID=MMETSP0963-20130614/32064_1 /ASSEMBLY_ACC=CAM_ASM_000494 /TAXON_ID=4773 /ORGANISM="Schizochytrium aggregatum, Strain ATCC28209" /LENGTH=69 /DNA_ID=CAMNT_0048624451 /DNA_START=373 /DNA_END=582 /DNA_ORIENTATION=-
MTQWLTLDVSCWPSRGRIQYDHHELQHGRRHAQSPFYFVTYKLMAERVSFAQSGWLANVGMYSEIERVR